MTTTLSNPSKMPGLASMLPASTCKRGSKLRMRDGTVCSRCYACKGRYLFPQVQEAMGRQYDEISFALRNRDARQAYVTELARRITVSGKPFRHFASGDFQSAKHVALVCDVARLSPDVPQWASSREYGFVASYLRNGGTIPANLCVRMSSDVIGKPARDIGLPTATVGYDVTCDARERGGECGPCRKCWNPAVRNVGYPLH